MVLNVCVYHKVAVYHLLNTQINIAEIGIGLKYVRNLRGLMNIMLENGRILKYFPACEAFANNYRPICSKIASYWIIIIIVN